MAGLELKKRFVPIVTGTFHVAVVMGMMFERAFRKNVIASYTGC